MRRTWILSGAVRAAMLSGLLAGAALGADWPDLSSPPQAVGGGERDAAVVVGAENYTYVEHVPGAKRNADDWQAYLTGTLKIPADRVALLLDDDATNDAIRQAAAEKTAQVEPGGTLWFVFIGHGAPSKDGKDGLLVGVDAQQKASSVYSRSFSRNELLELLAKGKQAKTVVLIDACFSGKSPTGQALVAGLQPLLTMRALPAGVDDRTVLMTAARSDQFAGPLPGGDRPAFSYLALGALRGWAADEKGQVTAAGLVDYVRRALSLSRDRTQTPELSTPEKAAVVLGQGREAGPDMAKLQREAASSSGRGFQVTSLEAVPKPEAPKELNSGSSGVDLGNVDVDALEKYDAAVQFEKDGNEPGDKAKTWRQLAKDAPKFAELAEKRALEWDRFAEQKKAVEWAHHRLLRARDADWDKLGRLLALNVVSENDKRDWAGQFLKAYLRSPGIEPAMAKGLAPHVPPGATRQALEKLARQVPNESSATMAAAVLEHLKKIKDYRDLSALLDRNEDDAAWLKSDTGRAVVDQLNGFRSDAAATGVINTPDGRAMQYSIGGHRVTDSGISVHDLDASRSYRETIADAIAENITANPLSVQLQAALADFRAGVRPDGSTGTEEGKAGIQWIGFPGGKFAMGRDDAETSAKPVHEVTVKSFQMAKTLVTNKQYRACVAAGACTAAHKDAGPGDDDRPVTEVDWNQAKAFSAWAGGRLPTETEWEYAARGGGKERKFPWGDEEATCSRAVIKECGGDSPAPVCSKPAGNTPQGLCDMAGNVDEWVEDPYHNTYDGAPTDGSAWEAGGYARTVRAGAYCFPGWMSSAAGRVRMDPERGSEFVGFRPAR